MQQATLLTPSRRMLPLGSLLFRREYRHTSEETHGMRDFPAEAARMLGKPVQELEGYCAEAIAYDVVRRRAKETHTPLEERTIAYGESLYVLARALHPKAPVETGVCSGITTGYLLEAFRRNGDGTRLTSIDLPIFEENGMVNSDGIRDRSHVGGVAEVGILADPTLRQDPKRWDLRLGDAKVLLPQVLEQLGSIDFFYHDSEHSYAHMTFEYQAAWPHLVEGGVLVSDDINFSDGARTAWREFTAAHPGRSWKYFGPSGNRGVLQKGAAAAPGA